jgi:hypothetical protein
MLRLDYRSSSQELLHGAKCDRCLRVSLAGRMHLGVGLHAYPYSYLPANCHSVAHSHRCTDQHSNRDLGQPQDLHQSVHRRYGYHRKERARPARGLYRDPDGGQHVPSVLYYSDR